MLTAQLRKVLLLLVCLNLVFVQITGAVSLAWMLPLFGLTLASPYLWNLQRLLLYRVAWNVALIAIFALLIVDIRQSGIRYMLEDGLILAAFCQVHVLNNLLRQHRPDLVFFNSFLIALVTGFFCQDVVYSAVFLVYAVVLVTALALAASSTVVNQPSRILPPAELRGLVSRSIRQGAVVLLFTAVVFATWPRDFDREGLVDDEFVESATAAEVAFADQIRLDRNNTAALTNRIVIRAKLRQGSQQAVPRYWRGATFTALHRYGWTADTNMQNAINRARQLDERWIPQRRGVFARPGHRTGAVIDVELTDSKALNLFVPSTANRIRFTCGAWPTIDGNFRLSRYYDGDIHYSMDLNAVDDPPRKVRGRPEWEHRRLRKRAIPKGSRSLDAQVRRLIPAGADRRTKVEVIRRFLSTERDYFLPGETGSAANLADFIAGDGGGHCEYFATTMVILLRLNQVPCRMVGGYLAHEWNEQGTELVIRSNHAHAWVEVWDENTGWFTVDPTPAQSEMATTGNSMFAVVSQFLHRTWKSVTSFDGKSRAAAFDWAKAQLAAFLSLLREHPIWAILAVLGLYGLRLWRHIRRRPKLHPEVRDYLGVLAKLKLHLRPGETPRQLLVRAADAELSAEDLTTLTAATRRHERARYR